MVLKEIGANGKNSNAIGTNGTNVTNQMVPLGEPTNQAVLSEKQARSLKFRI